MRISELENRCTGNRTVGSNPTLSAKILRMEGQSKSQPSSYAAPKEIEKLGSKLMCSGYDRYLSERNSAHSPQRARTHLASLFQAGYPPVSTTMRPSGQCKSFPNGGIHINCGVATLTVETTVTRQPRASCHRGAFFNSTPFEPSLRLPRSQRLETSALSPMRIHRSRLVHRGSKNRHLPSQSQQWRAVTWEYYSH